MNPAPYETASVRIRDDLAAAHRRAGDHIARPGTWLAGAERVAVAAEARHAALCRLCRERKEARADLGGADDRRGGLPDAEAGLDRERF